MDQSVAAISTVREAPPAYNTVAKWFHWITVGLLGIALPLGFVIKHVKEADQIVFYVVHESAGLTILLVAILRLLWRQANPPPPPAANMPRVLHRTANAVHLAFYVALIAQPILGFLATNAFGYPMQGQTAYLGFIDFPKFTEANVPVGQGLSAAHSIVGWSILVLLVLHIGGVLFHQAVRRDDTLLRMV